MIGLVAVRDVNRGRYRLTQMCLYCSRNSDGLLFVGNLSSSVFIGDFDPSRAVQLACRDWSQGPGVNVLRRSVLLVGLPCGCEVGESAASIVG